ncbi:amidohydrolase/deacetylase family metallohydrolase [Paenibacillus sacheonensis]|uniref:Amidohydrolase/deacetylase family metallohydrolase n=1 Tax=Paenibacillus sacheonensis TaxID=742054 RepID=A0A7X4YLS3_9BACL|nr:amidohydrolase/deacetylase family metallohydrolase [Paenibacillus sacheonensis]MBM7565988.1 dihydroorotase [Paenibacillus sacheonensis]NBC68698.1 amidohydrolase/deacetylase family metallohydrolase [Paenibacillus sacheonensis]
MGIVLRKMKRMDGQEADIVIEGGRIAAIVPSGTGEGEVVAEGGCVSDGWIDMHVHAFREFKPYGDAIDEIGVKQGVTTIVDAGSCGADRIGELREAGSRAATRLLAFLNVSRIGLERVDELSNPAWLDENAINEAVRAYPEFIVGLKARISRSVVKEQGIEPLRRARRFSEATGLSLMVHVGSGPPAIGEVIALLAPGDIVTHYLNGKANNLFDNQGRPLPALLDAIDRGVHLDVGHGTASFSFRVAEQARAAGLPLHTISTDIYESNRIGGPVYSLADVMSKFLYLGYSLREVVDAVTVNAAQWLGRPELCGLKVGGTADLTLFDVVKGSRTLVDSEGASRTADTYIQVKGAVIDGSYFAC